MLRSFILGLIAACALVPGASSANKPNDDWKPTPIIRSVDPDPVKVGGALTLTGEYLDKTQVREFFLTDGTNDFKAAIVKQQEKQVRITIPASVKPGRFRLMVLTNTDPPRYLEMPSAVTVE